MRHDDDKAMEDVRRRIPINGTHEPDKPGMAADSGAAAETDAVAADAAGIADGVGPRDDAVVGDAATEERAAPPVDTAGPEAAAADTTGDSGGASDADPGVGSTAGQAEDEGAADILGALDAVLAERDQYLDALQRLKAEFENYRRRSQREVAEAGSRARAALLAEFLPVLDNLDRALSAAEHHEEGKVLEGVRLTHNLFVDLLRKEGVVEVEALGRSFDPTMHEALVMQRSDDHEEGTVTAVLERGYLCGDRVLRPAKVAVSAGPSA